jgi:large subunit ribosomal protein LP0|mmetsp:Transcript_67679/g.98971  ORF Transcript_67679/g.98971 Transcript_67679/m.98971 type:complete len:306 (-) Transcript_67679:1690-2607(-)
MLNQLEKKTLYFERFDHLFSHYSRIVLVNIENITSNQFKKCRKALGKNSILILGKNKIIKKVLKEHIKKKPELVELFPYLSGNIGFIFTTLEATKIKEILLKNRLPSPAKAGQLSPSDVVIPAGITSITPDGTSFFQALNIQTKISKGLIEIQTPVKIITKDQLIGNSEVILLQKLNIIPFSHCLEIKLIYENNFCINPKVLDISMIEIENILLDKKMELKLLESFFLYPNSIKIENQIKKSMIDLVHLAQKLGFVVEKTPINKNCGGEVVNGVNLNQNKKSIESERITEKSDSEDEDMGFGLFD